MMRVMLFAKATISLNWQPAVMEKSIQTTAEIFETKKREHCF
jgi:hypothetical protein